MSKIAPCETSINAVQPAQALLLNDGLRGMEPVPVGVLRFRDPSDACAHDASGRAHLQLHAHLYEEDGVHDKVGEAP
eukprot:CAMPEP_0180113658 /NCGR_PEP_ID=MMETSP0985-20121206/36891_1 /TAXON_ID=483367 /ORGANISM="non described non described, Strain CCMP 2436" /LENGTH=76 /DNA_ID=CAMNT_0022052159 /DNA_START=480 /DNA_END=707 /DNA_ORIENTATION=+